MSETQHWWQNATVYQIYPRSFADSNGDGIGDIPGIIGKLDYLQQLGIGIIWLSPIFDSPMADNGYDIADYQAIAPEFGTLGDFDRLVAGAKGRGIGILLDLVVNHTSDEHRWFADARSSRSSRYRDFYVWREPAPGGGVPNGIPSIFGGPAWTLDEATGQYYFHQFARKQPDLNWANPELRAEIYRMMNWWLERGIAGFRMDVINLIAKEPDRGITADGPRLHEYLTEMHRETFGGRDVLTVGESWTATPETALLYSGQDRHELSMVFQFEHIMQQWHETWGKWQPKPFDLVAFKRVVNRWQYGLAEDGWNSLFWGNHDLPRAVSKYGDDKRFRVESAKMLATVLHLLKG
ncbi:MAG: alpha-glucosidase, partial [Devosia sp.]|nr:alpha-glucosidase [Devosia sp.]